MPDELLQRLRRLHDDYFPGVQDRFQSLVQDGQHPSILFIGCSDSRLVPYLLTGTGPGEVFMVRNVGAFVPPHDGGGSGGQALAGFHGTASAIEFAVLRLGVAASSSAATATAAASERCTRSPRRRPSTSRPGSNSAAKPRCRCR